MSLDEKRLLMLGISKINPLTSGKEPIEFDVVASEWTTYYKGNLRHAYQRMQEAATALMGRQVEIREPTKTGSKLIKMQWVDKCEYQEGEGRVSIKFGSSIAAQLIGLTRQFTKTDLLNVGELSSVHSIRIYEMLSQFRDTGWRIMELEKLKEALSLHNCYPDFTDFKKRVIAPSVKDINEKTDLMIYDTEVIKTGKRVTSLKFKMRNKEQLRLAF